MRRKIAGLVPILAMLMGATPPVPKASEMIVHEWGTFLAMSGSDGVSLDGMYHEEHPLPHFVHSRGRDQLHPRSIFLKGETPVIYFYAKTEQPVRVEVKFPHGLWTQWYPNAAGVWPAFSATPTADALRDGRIVWHARVLPVLKAGDPPLPPTSADALWNFARDVDAAFVRTEGPKGFETERYLFYRGLGTAPLPIRMTAQSGGTLSASAEGRTNVQHVFVLRVENGKGAYAYKSFLVAGEEATGMIPSMEKALPLESFASAIGDDLSRRLVESGLYPKEARAMVNTWKQSYFKTEGVRALFVLPQRWTDGFIPITVAPKPKELVRVMVGRLELLMPERERLAENAVRDLSASDSARRSQAFAYLKAQGRYVEPVLRRVLETTRDEAVKRLCKRLLLADFVTELRTALRSEPDSMKIPVDMIWNEDPVYVRAQLASLLRDVGLDKEARAEGATALKLLRVRKPELAGYCEEHREAKAWGRALEAIGDDWGVSNRYGRVVELGALATRTKDCRSCHQQSRAAIDIGAREWWVGERYAAALSRSGGLNAAIARVELESVMDQAPADLKLLYLYAASGRDSKPKSASTNTKASDIKDGATLAEPGLPRPTGN